MEQLHANEGLGIELGSAIFLCLDSHLFRDSLSNARFDAAREDPYLGLSFSHIERFRSYLKKWEHSLCAAGLAGMWIDHRLSHVQIFPSLGRLVLEFT